MSENTIRTLELIILYYGIPVQIQSDNGSHFKNKSVQQFTETHNIQWIFHIPYYPQSAGLIERMNGLLKEQSKKLGGGQLTSWREHFSEALQILNNRPIGEMATPLMRMITPNLQIKPLTVTEEISYWEIQDGAVASYRATPDAAGLDLYRLQQYQLNVRDICIINTGVRIQFPPGYFGQIAPRSSLAVKGIQVLGGVIDADYQGEIQDMLLNSGVQDLLIQPQDDCPNFNFTCSGIYFNPSFTCSCTCSYTINCMELLLMVLN